MLKPTEYRNLIQQFLDGNFTDAEEFAKTYNKIFLPESSGNMDTGLFDILENFWEHVEVYSSL